MSKLSAESVTEAIRQLTALDFAPQANAWVEVYLVGKRYQGRGDKPTLATIDGVAREIFVVLPDHPLGRIQPFRLSGVTDGGKIVGWNDNGPDTGRKTNWDNGSRNNARALFSRDHIQFGLVGNATARLATFLGDERRIPRAALLVFLLRDHEFPEGDLALATLEAAAKQRFNLSAADLDAITTDIPLQVPLGGNPPWAPEHLPDDLRPREAPHVGTAGAAVERRATADIVVDPRLRRMVERAIASSRAVLLVGPPGTGKSTLLHEVASAICADPKSYGIDGPPLPPPMWVTAEEGWAARDIVGGETIVDAKIAFRPGAILRAIAENRWMIIDEINRADMDRIFGPIFTWLSDATSVPPVTVGCRSPAAGEPDVELAWADAPECSVENERALQGSQVPTGENIVFRAGTAWRLLGTYNAVDAQRVFRVGQALGRRFLRVPVPPISTTEFRTALEESSDLDDSVRDKIALVYESHLQSPSTTLGPALFLRMARYVEEALRRSAPGDDLAAVARDAFVESYLINVGAWLARNEPEDLEELGVRLVATGGPLEAADWAWVRKMIPNLG